MSALKLARIENEMEMIPPCHPERPLRVLYVPDRGGDRIIVKCRECYRIFVNVRLPKESE